MRIIYWREESVNMRRRYWRESREIWEWNIGEEGGWDIQWKENRKNSAEWDESNGNLEKERHKKSNAYQLKRMNGSKTIFYNNTSSSLMEYHLQPLILKLV